MHGCGHLAAPASSASRAIAPTGPPAMRCLPPSGCAHVSLKQGKEPLHAHELQPNTESRATELVRNLLISPAMKSTWV